jgi:hypothetical protein
MEVVSRQFFGASLKTPSSKVISNSPQAPVIPVDTWKFMLELVDYKANPYPIKALDELKKISDYCRANGIKIVFVIPPIHSELRDRIRHYYAANKKFRKFKRDMARLGQVIDFDYDNDFTTKRENFSDPYHLSAQVDGMMMQEVWGNKRFYAREFTAVRARR